MTGDTTEMVTITKKEWEDLIAAQNWLNYLKECGGDDWSGYFSTIEMCEEGE